MKEARGGGAPSKAVARIPPLSAPLAAAPPNELAAVPGPLPP